MGKMISFLKTDKWWSGMEDEQNVGDAAAPFQDEKDGLVNGREKAKKVC